MGSELSLPSEQVMDVGGSGGGRTGGLSGSMSAGTARNGGRVCGLFKTFLVNVLNESSQQNKQLLSLVAASRVPQEK